MLIGYLPCVKFTEGTDYNTMLSDRLFHQCLKIILAPLNDAGRNGALIVNSTGDRRCCFPRIAAYLADYQEQCTINVTNSRSSVTTTATYAELGNSEPNPPCTRKWILSRIRTITERVDPLNLPRYQAEARAISFGGVHEPFWADLPGYDPSLVLSPDLLHGVHGFWRSQVLVWIINLIGYDELDRRLKLLQPIVGIRHFSKGISHLSQWTGREDRELQRVILAVVDGHARLNGKAMECLCAIHDFIYLAQYRSHTDGTLKYLSDALATFHRCKNIFIKNGGRSGKDGVIPHFNIPKLCALHSYERHIPELGSSPQFSSDISEALHKSMAKAAYEATNRKEFLEQMCRFLHRCDSISDMEEFIAWAKGEASRRKIDKALHGTGQMFREFATRRMNAALDAELTVPLKQRGRTRDWNRRGWSDRLFHRFTPHFRDLTLDDVCSMYQFSPALFIDSLRRFDSTLPVALSHVKMDVWTSIYIKLPTVQEDDLIQSRTIQTMPRSSSLPNGRFSCVLVHFSDEAKATGIEGMLLSILHMTLTSY